MRSLRSDQLPKVLLEGTYGDRESSATSLFHLKTCAFTSLPVHRERAKARCSPRVSCSLRSAAVIFRLFDQDVGRVVPSTAQKAQLRGGSGIVFQTSALRRTSPPG